MKNIDKKTLIVLSSLVAVGLLIVFVSERLQRGKQGFDVTDTTTVEKATVATTTKPTTTEVPITEPATTEPTTTEPTTTEPTTTEPEAVEPETTVVQKVFSLYQQYFTPNDTTLTLNADKTYSLCNSTGTGSFNGKIVREFKGEDVLGKTKLSKRDFKKMGLNYKLLNLDNLYYVELQYGNQIYADYSKEFCVNYKNDVFNSKRNSFEFVIYYDDSGICIYDINNQVKEIDFSNYYF